MYINVCVYVCVCGTVQAGRNSLYPVRSMRSRRAIVNHILIMRGTRRWGGVYPGCTVYNDDNEVGNMIYFASPFRPDVSFVRPPIALA